uniref:Protein FAR1-RELATED SEQUENCE n=1 Tax=Lactuca sativa TaxID=4236 RepID=A0A9R1XAA6_LACSA|nr:hypothetical protein LSAT_V11C500246450 [Lactuca sativa]
MLREHEDTIPLICNYLFINLEGFLHINNIYRIPNVLKYLDDFFLNKYKEIFVSLWIDQYLSFGQRTNNRIESQHSTLKKKNYSLAKFVGTIDRFMKSQLTTITESNVSLKALDMLVEELQRVHQVYSSNYGCKLQNSCGFVGLCV